MFLFEFEQLDEKWSEKYKRSINCANPRGFSQRAHCQGRKKNEELEVVNEKKKRRKNKSAAVGSYGWHGYYYGNSENTGDSGGGIEESTNTTVKEDNTQPKTGTKSAIYSTDVYGSTAYHSKCLEPGCDWESRRYDSIKLAQNAAQKHAQKHFKQGVAEAFDQPYKLKWEKSEHGDYDALATLDDGTYLTIMFNNEYKKNWMVEFYRNNSQAVTGEGDAQRIFATVLAAIGQFVKKKKPDSLFFSAVKEDDPSGSRTKLYDRLVQRYAGNLGYSVQRQEHPGQMAYKLIRSNQTNENFANGKKPGRKGLAKRVGVNCKQSVSKLRSIAANSSGERQRMAHWCANMKSGKRKVNESTDYSNLQSALNDFLPLVMKELDLKQLPKIRLLKKINHGGQPSFGSFSSNGINLSVEGRHPVDVCRTLAHELVHYKQGTQNQLNQDSGETGSPEENQANSIAGIIMRKFSQEFPQHIG